MNGWTLAGFLIGFMVGAIYGINIQKRMASKAINKASDQMMALALVFAKKLNEPYASVFKKEARDIAETVARLDDYRPPKKTRPF